MSNFNKYKKNNFLKKMFHRLKDNFFDDDIKKEINNEIISPLYHEIKYFIFPHYVTFFLLFLIIIFLLIYIIFIISK
jgi:hypothetical protein